MIRQNELRHSYWLQNNLHVALMVMLGGFKESRYFCDSLFWASQPKQAAKDYATVILLRKPRYPWHNIVPTQQGDRNIVPIVDAAYREASVFHLRVATDQHPALCSYRGLKIFTSLSLRFQDFQRLFF